MTATDNRRVLVVDDNDAVHRDFDKILAPPARRDVLEDLESALFDTAAPTEVHGFELAHAQQGDQAADMVRAACAAGTPYALAFVDMRMPPGPDGVETIELIWKIDPAIQIVICSAYSDYSWSQLLERLGRSDALLVVKKPFDVIEVVQAAYALTEKWNLGLAYQQRLAREIAERDRIAEQLRLAHKLEAVGQLAAGVAHEINTPVQYVGDSLQFIREGTMSLVQMATEVMATSANSPLEGPVKAIADSVDLDYLAHELPSAFDAVQGGVLQIGKIVRAMKELSHPGPREAVPIDVDAAITSALQLTASEYKYTADVVLELAKLPLVHCFPNDLNQVLINLIVNAAQAMAETKGRRGTLTIQTRLDGDHVIISVGDNGPGIPETIRERVYDAFFTTKEVGRGTGQGLAISRSIIVDRHGGTMSFDTRTGVGTTFHIRIPIAGPGHDESLSSRAG